MTQRKVPGTTVNAAPENHLPDIFDVGRLALFVASRGASALRGHIESANASHHHMT